MKTGVVMFLTSYSIDVTTLAQRAEALGFDYLWLPEHPIIPAQYSSPWPGGSPDGKAPDYYAHIVDPFVALGRASAVTKTLKLGTGVTLVPERNPLLLAKEVATLDHYSGGRFLFGVGAGWLKEETETMGADFSRRWSVVREGVLAMKELWTKEEAEFHGEFFEFPPVRSFPKPVQKPHPPVILGGAARNVFKRVVAWGDGWLPNLLTPEQVKRGRSILNDLATEAGRDPRSIEIHVFGQPADPDLFKRFEEAGADEVMVRLTTAPEQEALAELERAAERVLA